MIESKEIDPFKRSYHFRGTCNKCGHISDIWTFGEDKKPKFYNTDSLEDMSIVGQMVCPNCKSEFNQ